MRSLLGYLLVDWIMLAFKAFGPSGIGHNVKCLQVFRLVNSLGRPDPPQGSDSDPYPKAMYRQYELMVDCSCITMTLLVFLICSLRILYLPIGFPRNDQMQ